MLFRFLGKWFLPMEMITWLMTLRISQCPITVSRHGIAHWTLGLDNLRHCFLVYGMLGFANLLLCSLSCLAQKTCFVIIIDHLSLINCEELSTLRSGIYPSNNSIIINDLIIWEIQPLSLKNAKQNKIRTPSILNCIEYHRPPKPFRNAG